MTDCTNLETHVVTSSFKPASLNPKTASCWDAIYREFFCIWVTLVWPILCIPESYESMEECISRHSHNQSMWFPKMSAQWPVDMVRDPASHMQLKRQYCDSPDQWAHVMFIGVNCHNYKSTVRWFLVGLWGIRCTPLQQYRATLCAIDLHCAPPTCVWTIVHKGYLLCLV